MNKQIEKLHEISKKPSRSILGLMSGTSLDGLDMALCKFTGHGTDTVVELLHFETFTYPSSVKEEIKTVLFKTTVDLEMLCLLNEKIGALYADIINKTIKNWGLKPDDIDLIASHGQTIYHAPKIKHQKNNFPNGTLQIGDADHIASKTGIITLSDFRQKHVAAGGEGAPLAIYGDYLLFNNPEKDRFLLNIGGIANFTFLPANSNKQEIVSTDTGPGNTLMDQFMFKKFGKYYDKDAEIASRGNINTKLLEALLDHSFFKEDFPKSTGPELFNLEYLQKAQEKSLTENILSIDVMATLSEFTAISIGKAINYFAHPTKKTEIILSGGGVHNPLLVSKLKSLISFAEFSDTSINKIDPDAKEAVLFALLANECVGGNPETFYKTTIPAISMGKISLPN